MNDSSNLHEIPNSTVPARVPVERTSFRPREYAHIVFATANPDALINWYCSVLGMQIVMRHALITFLTWDDSQDRLAIVSAPGALPRNPLASGLHHAAFSVGSLRELVDQYRHLLKEGISPIRCMNHGVATSMYYRDPDDNEIELTVEAFSTVAELNAWFETGAFDANPVGILLDPEDLCRRVDSGEAETSILRPDPNHAFRLQEYLEKRQ